MRDWIVRDILSVVNISQFAEIADVSRPYVYRLIKEGKIKQHKDGSLPVYQAFQIKTVNDNKRLLSYSNLITLGNIHKNLDQQGLTLEYVFDQLYEIFMIYNASKHESLFDVKRYIISYFRFIIENMYFKMDTMLLNRSLSDSDRMFYREKCSDIYTEFLTLEKVNQTDVYVEYDDVKRINRILVDDFDVTYNDMYRSLLVIFDYYLVDVCTELDKAFELDNYVFRFMYLLIHLTDVVLLNNEDQILVEVSLLSMIQRHIIKPILAIHLTGFK